MSFADLDGDVRMAHRAAAEELGAYVVGYEGGGLMLALPRVNGSDVIRAMQARGLHFVPGSLYYFPLGTDKPGDFLRHDGPYPGSRGFWLYASFAVGP